MRKIIIIAFLISFSVVNSSQGFWIWTPKTKEFKNPKWSAKSTPQGQYQFAKEILDSGDYNKALIEFRSLIRHFPESREAADSQFYIGECLEKMDKFYDAYLAYQKVIDKYAFTDKLNDVLEREFRIADAIAEEKIKMLGLEFPQYYHAVRIYEKIIDNSPYSDIAALSQYRIGLVFKSAGDFNEAKKEFEKLISTYPESEWVEAAKFQLAKSASLASLDADYDQGSTREAKDRYEEFVATHPQTELTQEAQEEIIILTDKEAEKDFRVGEFYEKQEAYSSAKIYYDDVIRKYPKSTWAKQSQERIRVLVEERKL